MSNTTKDFIQSLLDIIELAQGKGLILIGIVTKKKEPWYMCYATAQKPDKLWKEMDTN